MNESLSFVRSVELRHEGNDRGDGDDDDDHAMEVIVVRD